MDHYVYCSHLVSAWRTFFSISCKSGWLAANSVFVCLAQSLFHHHFLNSSWICNSWLAVFSFFLSFFLSFFFFFFVFLSFSELHLRHMEVPRLGVESELWLPAYARTTAPQDPSRICDLYHSSRKCWILDPLSKARNCTRVLMDASPVC